MADLARFREAQDRGGIFEQALAELSAGKKRSHWMWFVFPQLAGLGHSEMARRYAISSLEEARAYLEDPELGRRLRACVAALLDCGETSAERILGPIDALKLRSSMTLFAVADPDEALFDQVLERFYAGERDGATLTLLGR